MAPIVIPNIVRYAVNGSYAGETVANILDMEVVVTSEPIDDRAEAIFEVAGDILNNWDDHLLNLATERYTATSVSWVDLNSFDGETGSRSSTSANTWPAPGRNTGTGMPGNVSCRVEKNQSGGRRTRNGRMYLVGHSEQGTDVNSPNLWTSAHQAAVNETVSDFLDGINNEAGPDGREQALVVLHTPEGAAVSSSLVTSLTCRPVVATQSRRLPGR